MSIIAATPEAANVQYQQSFDHSGTATLPSEDAAAVLRSLHDGSDAFNYAGKLLDGHDQPPLWCSLSVLADAPGHAQALKPEQRRKPLMLQWMELIGIPAQHDGLGGMIGIPSQFSVG
jgi:hypothetical protein